ncbi:MAG: 50S ribosomal protein L1 [Candidatus Dormibacteria bacterium]|jgi:large subunit ribosomal protein L1
MAVRHGKRYLAAQKLLEDKQLVDPREGVRLVREVNISKFPGTVELHVRLGVDPRHADQMVRSSVVLPHGTGKVRRIIVFAQGEKEREAREAGAEIIGAEDLVKRIQEGFLDFDVALATPDLMGSVGKLGKVLGPRGLMPNPKAGTVTFDIARAIREVQAGRVEFRVDRYGIVHVPVGKTNFEEGALFENLSAMLEAIVKAKPSAAKGVYIRAAFLAPSMGPSVRLDPVLAARLTAA